MSSSGNLNEGYDFICHATNLLPGTNYAYRVCGRKDDYIYDGGLSFFTTKASDNICDESIVERGGSEGLQIRYYMGSTAGDVDVIFDAFDIPDKMKIWQNGVKKLSTPGFISDRYTGTINYNPDNGAEFDLSVDGNSDLATGWKLELSCPK